MSKIKTNAKCLRAWIESRTAEGKWLALKGKTDSGSRTSLPFRGFPRMGQVCKGWYCSEDDHFDLDAEEIISVDDNNISFRRFSEDCKLTLSVTDSIEDSSGRTFDPAKVDENLNHFGQNDLAELAANDTDDSVLLAVCWDDRGDRASHYRSSFYDLVFEKFKTIAQAEVVPIDMSSFSEYNLLCHADEVDVDETECAIGMTNYTFYTCKRTELSGIANTFAKPIVDDLVRAARLRAWIEARTAEGKWLDIECCSKDSEGDIEYWGNSLPFQGMPDIEKIFCINGEKIIGDNNDIFNIDEIIEENDDEFILQISYCDCKLTLSVVDPFTDSSGRILDPVKVWEAVSNFEKDDLAELAANDTDDSVLLAVHWHDSEMSGQHCRRKFFELVFDKMPDMHVCIDDIESYIFENIKYTDIEKTECFGGKSKGYGNSKDVFTFYTCERNEIDKIAIDFAEMIINDLANEE